MKQKKLRVYVLVSFDRQDRMKIHKIYYNKQDAIEAKFRFEPNGRSVGLLKFPIQGDTIHGLYKHLREINDLNQYD